MDLTAEWRQHPPLPLMVQLLVEGLCGVSLAHDEAPKRYTTAEELIALLGEPERVEQPRCRRG